MVRLQHAVRKETRSGPVGLRLWDRPSRTDDFLECAKPEAALPYRFPPV